MVIENACFSKFSWSTKKLLYNNYTIIGKSISIDLHRARASLMRIDAVDGREKLS